jgi:hypothetical protein
MLSYPLGCQVSLSVGCQISCPVGHEAFLSCIDGHNRQWIDGLVPMVSIDTFGLIFIDVIDPSIKDFFIFD